MTNAHNCKLSYDRTVFDPMFSLYLSGVSNVYIIGKKCSVPYTIAG